MITEKNGKTAVVKPGADLTEKNSEKFSGVLYALVKEDFNRFVLDMSDVKQIDPVSLGTVKVLCSRPDLEFIIRNVSPPLMNMIELVRLDSRVTFE